MRLQERATRFFCVTVSAFLGLSLCLVGCGGNNPINAPSIEAIADQIVDVGSQVKVEVILIDADSEDIYALRVSSDHTGVALASLNGAILTLTGVAVGTATITVSATDASGQQSNEVTFEVTVVNPVAPTVAHEREALVALYEATDGPNWTMNTNWLTDHGLAWHGVRVIDGHVTELDLRSNGLSGELPDALGGVQVLKSSVAAPATAVMTSAAARPAQYRLGDSYPNPFNPAVVIPLDLAMDQKQVSLALYDVLGRRVRQLWQGPLQAGSHRFVWNGRDEVGKDVAAGVYIYQVEVDGRMEAKKTTKLP